MDKKLEINVGDYVAFNTLPDAFWFEVTQREGFAIMVREGLGYSEQRSDVSLVKQVRKPDTK